MLLFLIMSLSGGGGDCIFSCFGEDYDSFWSYTLEDSYTFKGVNNSEGFISSGGVGFSSFSGFISYFVGYSFSD